MKRSSVAPVQLSFVQYVNCCSVRTIQGSLGGPPVPTTNPHPRRAGAAAFSGTGPPHPPHPLPDHERNDSLAAVGQTTSSSDFLSA